MAIFISIPISLNNELIAEHPVWIKANEVEKSQIVAETNDSKRQEIEEKLEKISAAINLIKQQKMLEEQARMAKEAKEEEESFYASVVDSSKRIDEPSGLSDEQILAKYRNFQDHPEVAENAEKCLELSKRYQVDEFLIGAIITVESGVDPENHNLTGQTDNGEPITYVSTEECLEATFQNWYNNYLVNGFVSMDEFLALHTPEEETQQKIKDYYIKLATMPTDA